MANQTIIQAAKAAYTVPKIDYSGYIKGAAAVATGLINLQKAVEKKANTLGGLEIKADMKGMEPQMEWVRNIASRNPKVYNIAKKYFEDVANNNINIDTLGESIEGDIKDMSASTKPQIESWFLTVAQGRLTQTGAFRSMISGDRTVFSLMHDDSMSKREKVKWIKDHGIHDGVLGPEGNHIDARDMPKTFPLKSNSDDLFSLTDKFFRKVSDTSIDPDEFDSIYNITYTGIVEEAQDDEAVLSAMVDRVFPKKGTDGVRFVEWYFDNKTDQDDFNDQWNDWLLEKTDDPTDPEDTKNKDVWPEFNDLSYLKMKQIILTSSYDFDEEIKDDFLRFIKEAMDSYKQ